MCGCHSQRSVNAEETGIVTLAVRPRSSCQRDSPTSEARYPTNRPDTIKSARQFEEDVPSCFCRYSLQQWSSCSRFPKLKVISECLLVWRGVQRIKQCRGECQICGYLCFCASIKQSFQHSLVTWCTIRVQSWLSVQYVELSLSLPLTASPPCSCLCFFNFSVVLSGM